jgi:hypothetical protein
MDSVKMAVKAIKRTDRKKAKANAKTKSKSNAKRSKKHLYYTYYNEITNFKFIPYTGSRWKIPSGITVTPSVKYKFERLETLRMKDVLCEIKKQEKENIYTLYKFVPINYLNKISGDISNVPWIKSNLISLQDREQNEWRRVRTIYSALFKVIRCMNKLVSLRRVSICMKKHINVEDIVTMEVPKKPIYVINYPERCTYVYEADTMRRSINTKLLMSDWMFENPQYPINPLSNEPFTTGQLLSIYNQMKAYGSFSWIFNRFKACSFNLKLFKLRFKQQLKLEAIGSHFKNEHENSKETIFDLFEANAVNYGMSDTNIEKFKTFYNLYPNSNYNIKIKPLVMRYYIAIELNDLSSLTLISFEIKRVIERYLNDI